MQIALDAMGGDLGPQELISGALLAVERHDRMDIVHAPTVVEMDENPVGAIRRKKDSSIMVAFDLVKSGQATAAVSAGNSGATLAAGVRKLGRLKNVARPGLASAFPTLKAPMSSVGPCISTSSVSWPRPFPISTMSTNPGSVC